MRLLLSLLIGFSASQAFAWAESCELRQQNAESVQSNNKKVVEQFFNHVTAGKVDDAFELVSDDVSWWVPGDLPFSGTKTKADYMVIVNQITNGFPNGFELKVKSMISEGDKVAAEVVSDGNHVNGKKYNNHYHFLVRIQDGKFIEVKEYMDTLHLHQLITPN